MRVTIFVEGGGDSSALRSRCRKAFSDLFEKSGFRGRMPAVRSCGTRREAFDSFLQAMLHREDDELPILLVDSEDLVTLPSWRHLQVRDHWDAPSGVTDDQAQLMVACMETWVMADREALRRVFGQDLQESALFPQQGLEQRTKDDVQARLEQATRNCGRGRAYAKGRRSFQALAEVDPETLKQHLPRFRKLHETLDALLTA